MNKYERLTEKMSEADLKHKERGFECLKINHPCGYIIGTKEYLLYKRLKELEDKIENGTLIEFPRIVPPIKYNNYSLWSVEYVNRAYGNISTDFYGTKEDAEERLKELQGE